MNVLVHIGYPKTASSFIQWLVLKPEKGYCNPWSVTSGEASEYFICTHPQRFNPEEVVERFQDAIVAAKGEHLRPVLSHEILSGLTAYGPSLARQVADRLKSTFPEAQILFVVREQRSMLRSLYGQYIRADGELPLREFIGVGWDRPGFRPACRLDHYEYDLMLDLYRERYGADRVLALLFEDLKADALGFEQKIHDFAGTGHRADSIYQPENVGYGAMTVALGRYLNLVFRRHRKIETDYKKMPLGYRMKGKALRMIDPVIPRRWHQSKEAEVKQIIAEHVGDYYVRSNRRFAEMTGLDLASRGYRV